MGQENKRLRILIAASGSGGHLLPARYIAEELKNLTDVEIEFCGTGRYLEKTLIENLSLIHI